MDVNDGFASSYDKTRKKEKIIRLRLSSKKLVKR